MDLVVGWDGTARGEDALVSAAALAAASGDGVAMGVVIVLTQVELDRTGELSLDQKRRTAVERAFPATWRSIEEVLLAAGHDPEALAIDVIVRIAEGHLARSQQRIAAELVQVALEHGAERLVIGRRGRPDGVADHLLRVCALEEAATVKSALVLRLDLAKARAGVTT